MENTRKETVPSEEDEAEFPREYSKGARAGTPTGTVELKNTGASHHPRRTNKRAITAGHWCELGF